MKTKDVITSPDRRPAHLNEVKISFCNYLYSRVSLRVLKLRCFFEFFEHEYYLRIVNDTRFSHH